LLEDLVEPVHHLDVGVPTQLAERGGALDGLVSEAVELSEQCDALDFRHGFLSFRRRPPRFRDRAPDPRAVRPPNDRARPPNRGASSPGETAPRSGPGGRAADPRAARFRRSFEPARRAWGGWRRRA